MRAPIQRDLGAAQTDRGRDRVQRLASASRPCARPVYGATVAPGRPNTTVREGQCHPRRRPIARHLEGERQWHRRLVWVGSRVPTRASLQHPRDEGSPLGLRAATEDNYRTMIYTTPRARLERWVWPPGLLRDRHFEHDPWIQGLWACCGAEHLFGGGRDGAVAKGFEREDGERLLAVVRLQGEEREGAPAERSGSAIGCRPQGVRCDRQPLVAFGRDVSAPRSGCQPPRCRRGRTR